jgi:hypothetical protein
MAEVDVQGNGKRRFQDDARETRAHAQAFASSLGNTMKDVDGVVRNVTERSPYAALGAALGLGFILGGGIPPALIRGLAGFAGRYAMAALLSMVVAEETAKKEVKHEEGR